MWKCFSAGETGVLYNIRLHGHIEETFQDIRQEVKAWTQMGFTNGQQLLASCQTSFKVV